MTGAVLVIPQGWFNALQDPVGAAAPARETVRIEMLAVNAVIEVERGLGHEPTNMPHNNPGYDIESDTPSGIDFIEVKGRVANGNTFILTRQEAVTALNKREHSVLALVRIQTDDATEVRYVRCPLNEPIQPWQTAMDADWDYFWDRGTEMGAK